MYIQCELTHKFRLVPQPEYNFFAGGYLLREFGAPGGGHNGCGYGERTAFGRDAR